MKIYSLPSRCEALLFDIDLTLYRDKGYYNSQADLLIRRFAEVQGVGLQEAERMVEAERNSYKQESGGKVTSLGNIYLRLGVTIEESVRWREELFTPERFLRGDTLLKATLEKLTIGRRIAAVTNNPASIGVRTLSALGVFEFFSIVVGLDTCMISKPAEEPFRYALKSLESHPNSAVCVGDRFVVDLEIPLAMGMGAILVESMEDVYRLPQVLT